MSTEILSLQMNYESPTQTWPNETSFSLQRATIFAIVFFVLHEATCLPQGLGRQVYHFTLSPWNSSEIKQSATSSIPVRVRVRVKRQTHDRCCVKKILVLHGRRTFQCQEEHPDCFSKTDSHSQQSFGMCETVRDIDNFVIACRCAAKK